MPGSSPVKQHQHQHRKAGLPLSQIDLNTISTRIAMAATPPPSSPVLSPTKPKAPAPAPAQTAAALSADYAELIPNPDDSDDVPYILQASKAYALVVGRSKAHDLVIPPPSTQGLGAAKRVVRLNLPNHARHVSRTHAMVEWIPFSDTQKRGTGTGTDTGTGTYIVRILGQNGLIVDGKRRREGQVLRLTPRKSVLDFFGVQCRVHIALDELGERQRQLEVPASPPPSSPPTLTFGSPSKGTARFTAAVPMRDDQDQDQDQDSAGSSSPTLSRRLVAGANAQRRLMAGASEDEDASDDQDYVPDRQQQEQQLVAGKRKVTPTASPSKTVKRAKNKTTTGTGTGTGTVTTTSVRRIKLKRAEPTPTPTPAKAVVSESQAKMPPPMPMRAQARRSASNSPAPGGSVHEQQQTARRCIRLLACTYDLEGLLAGAIVFHRTATISASEAVRSVLASTPSMMRGEAGEQRVAFSPSKRSLDTPSTQQLQHGQVVEGWEGLEDKWTRKAWREHLEVVLQSSPMFGVIHRAGKDASGNPLECWYYYDKEQDTDRERADNLGAFAKPMRKAIKGQKPIFWKKSGYGSHKDDFAIALAPTDEETASDEESRRERLRVRIASSGVWDETQPEEKESTWDKVGDQDWKKSK